MIKNSVISTSSRRWIRLAFLGVGFSYTILGCAGVRSRYHTVSPEDTWTSIAHQYGVSANSLKAHNPKRSVASLRTGEKLYVPFEESGAWNSDLLPAEYVVVPMAPADGGGSFSWPVMGSVSSGFGLRYTRRRGERNHDGIDIVAPKGTAVKASRSGHVIYASNRISGYGNMVIVQHAEGFSTVYAHLSRFAVKKGQYIGRGQKVGLVGRTGRASGVHLHFEVRKERLPVDPLLYLQGQYATNMVAP
jgi:murein DD-endopeptidase MepM/ murein hydrolase activator NlpD